MSERKAIERTQAPHTRRSLGTDLTSIGVTEGYVVLVHSSFSAIGWVCGGPVTLIQALLKRSDGWVTRTVCSGPNGENRMGQPHS